MGDSDIDKESFRQFLENRFSCESLQTDESRVTCSIIDLISKHQKNSVAAFLLDCAVLIGKLFDFKEVSIGLKDKADGLYKYGVIVGALPASQEALKKIAYTYEDMIDDVKYPGFKIGKFSKYCVTESIETEQKTFNRPGLIGKPRKSLDEFIEGDYIDTFMYGGGDELIGWIEVAGPKDGKIPDGSKFMRLELLASIISRIVWERMYRRELIM